MLPRGCFHKSLKNETNITVEYRKSYLYCTFVQFFPLIRHQFITLKMQLSKANYYPNSVTDSGWNNSLVHLWIQAPHFA